MVRVAKLARRLALVREGKDLARPFKTTAAAIVVALTSVFGSQAAAQAPTVEQVALTPEIVEAFIASYPDVRQTADGLSAQYGVDVGDGDDPSTAWQAWLAVTGAQNALNAVCQNYGFTGFQQWLQVMVSVATAYAFATGGGDVPGEMAAAIQQIQDDPNMTEAQKQMMMEQMQASMAMMGAIMPPQQNIDAVTPYVDQLAVLFDDA